MFRLLICKSTASTAHCTQYTGGYLVQAEGGEGRRAVRYVGVSAGRPKHQHGPGDWRPGRLPDLT